MSEFRPWTIVHVDVRAPLPDLSADSARSGVFLVWWCDRIPVGQLSIPAELLPLTASQLAAIVPAAIAPAVRHRLSHTAATGPRRHETSDVASSPIEQPADCPLPLEAFSMAIDARTVDADDAYSTVAIVVCTKNRPASLEACLASVRDLSIQPTEIIVVDNDPDSGRTRRVVEAFGGVRHIAERRPGLR